MRRQTLHGGKRVEDRERRRRRVRIARVLHRIPLQRQRLLIDQLAPLQQEVLQVGRLAVFRGEGDEKSDSGFRRHCVVIGSREIW